MVLMYAKITVSAGRQFRYYCQSHPDLKTGELDAWEHCRTPLLDIVLFLKVAKSSVDKRLGILFFSLRDLGLIRTWQATDPEHSQYN